MPKLNKPAQPGYRYAHPDETSAKSYMPHLEEDTVRSQRSDTERIRRGLDTAETRNAANRLRQQEAAGRAITRTTGRAGLVGAALQGGYEVGKEIDKRTGIGGKVVDAISRNSARERAIERMLKEPGEESYASVARKVDANIAAEKAAKGDEPEPEYRGGPSPTYKKGGAVSASKRADGCAQRGKTKGRMV